MSVHLFRLEFLHLKQYFGLFESANPNEKQLITNQLMKVCMFCKWLSFIKSFNKLKYAN